MTRWSMIFMKKSLCLALLMLVSFVCSLPRASEALMTFDACAPRFIRAGSPMSASHGLDSRLLGIRKFRRRKSHFVFTPHLSLSFLSSPSAGAMIRWFADGHSLFSRDPDPLIHPPA
jgi:hypothetical protein